MTLDRAELTGASAALIFHIALIAALSMFAGMLYVTAVINWQLALDPEAAIARKSGYDERP